MLIVSKHTSFSKEKMFLLLSSLVLFLIVLILWFQYGEMKLEKQALRMVRNKLVDWSVEMMKFMYEKY